MIKALEVAPRAFGTKSVVLRRFILQDKRLRQIGIYWDKREDREII